MNRFYVGLDLGSSSFHQTVLNHEGAVTVNRSFTTSEANLRAAFAALPGELHVHLEAGELAPWAAAVIALLITRVVCSHPRDNAWIAKDNDKCDRVDAYKLADLLRLNRFKEVHYAPDQARRDFKQLVQHYDELTAHQARWKTKLKARLRIQGVIVTGERLFSSAGRKTVLAKIESRDVRSAIKQLYEVLDQSVVAQQQARLLMLRAAQAFPEIKLLRTVPGVGPIGACRFSAYIHTPQRFSSKRKLWKYCRLSVSHRSSNGKPLRRPKLDYSGCGRLKDVSRKAFDVAQRLGTDNGFKRTYQRALETTNDKTHARLTVQRKIISTLRAIWLTRIHYRDELSR
ncbi:MAG TPA: transposase [Pyrinomonadaceae bacterium]|jgi:transposase